MSGLDTGRNQHPLQIGRVTVEVTCDYRAVACDVTGGVASLNFDAMMLWSSMACGKKLPHAIELHT